ncbi:hypothetical protein SAMN05421799_10418 [Alicyclobacillus vulcanalis]|uniref:Uncharacterized protein n=1 Tax=Alicyclobacillus vulcanalis TaxID=252246 RepID=A0A1N7LVS1_9BACL|nr:hypothetical protein SAMN05421799_10418 [Alicyclobacillus vulcanalis]
MRYSKTWVNVLYILVFTCVFSLLDGCLGFMMQRTYINNPAYLLFYAFTMIVAFFVSFVSNLWVSACLLYGRHEIKSWLYSLRKLIFPFICACSVVFIFSILLFQIELHLFSSIWKIVVYAIVFIIFSISLSFFGLQFSCVVFDTKDGHRSSFARAISIMRNAPVKATCMSMVIIGIIGWVSFLANRVTHNGINYTIDDTTLLLFGPLWMLGFAKIYKDPSSIDTSWSNEAPRPR